MSIKTKPINEYTFNNLNKLEEHLKNESETVKYLPAGDFVNRNSIFMDDEFYGRGIDWVSFNEESFSVFCTLIGMNKDFIINIKKEGLTSEVINDCLKNKNVKDYLKNYRFVVDTSDKNIVLGIVSNTYQAYPNLNLLKDLKEKFPLNEFVIDDSFVINTRFYLRLLSKAIKSGIITGSGGLSNDISQVGLQICNSMVGDKSVNIAYFIKRLICANGLIVETLNRNTRVFHSGNSHTFAERLKNAISYAYEGMDSIVEIIKNLNDIPFNPEKLVYSGGADPVYKIIPLQDKETESRKKLNSEELFEYDKEMIAGYPYIYAGKFSRQIFESLYRDNATMFDFINVFTEYAHNEIKRIEERIKTEKKTGELVKWIIENKEKLM